MVRSARRHIPHRLDQPFEQRVLRSGGVVESPADIGMAGAEDENEVNPAGVRIDLSFEQKGAPGPGPLRGVATKLRKLFLP